MESSLLTILPNLSIGVVSIGALVYTTIKFLTHLDDRSNKHETAMFEREKSLRSVESEIRTTVLTQLGKNTEIMNDTSKVLERAIMVLDKSR